MNAILKLFHKEWTDNQWLAFLQFVKFGIVGVSNTIVAYAINLLVLLIMKPLNVNWDIYVGNVVSFLLSVLWSFYWNNKYVFQKEDGAKRVIWKALLKTYASYAITGMVLTNVLSWLWVNICGVPKPVAPLINLLISVPLNFIMNKLWAFRSESEKKNDA